MYREMWVDLRPYLHPTPYTLKEKAAVAQVFRLFRGMGLRHVLVVSVLLLLLLLLCIVLCIDCRQRVPCHGVWYVEHRPMNKTMSRASFAATI